MATFLSNWMASATPDEQQPETLPESNGSASPESNDSAPPVVNEMYFEDGVRLIDYVLVFRKLSDDDTVVGKSESWQREGLTSKRTWRNNFIRGIRKNGLEIETTESRSCKKYVFVKLHAPWDTLCDYAESMGIRKPLSPNEVTKYKVKAQVEEMFSSWFPWGGQEEDVEATDVPDQPVNPSSHPENGKIKKQEDKPDKVMTSPFSSARRDLFLIEDKETFFSPAERSNITHYILDRIVFAQINEDKKFGIDELKKVGAVFADYPLHSHKVKTVFNVKNLLRGTWAYFLRSQVTVNAVQPLDIIRDYFGEKIAFFFCWMTFYTNMLVPLALLGWIVLLFGVIENSEFTDAICDIEKGGNFTMCPIGCLGHECDKECEDEFPSLKDSTCSTAQTFSILVDNKAIIFFAGCTTLWTFVFQKLWIRRTAVLQTEWHVRDLQRKENIRPQFYTVKGERRPHPITEELEPYISPREKYFRRGCSVAVTLFMIGVVMGGVMAATEFQVFLQCQMLDWSDISSLVVSTILSSLLGVAFIVVLIKVYANLCKTMTDFELHRTDSQWDDSFRLKYFIFCFINSNAAPFYNLIIVPFLKQDRTAIFGQGGSMTILLAVYMVGEPVIFAIIDFVESLIALIKSRRHEKEKASHEETRQSMYFSNPSDESNKCVKDFRSLTSFSEYTLTELYTDLMTQYGYITMYPTVFPLAAFCAVIRNVLTMKYLAYKFGKTWRRPVAHRASDIGVYTQIVRFISFCAVVTNAVIITTDTQLIPQLTYDFLYPSESELFIEFRLPETIEDNKTCRADFRIPFGVRDWTIADLWNDKIGLYFGILFVAGMLMLARLIAFLPNIPEEENIELKKESHLAQKILQEYIIRGAGALRVGSVGEADLRGALGGRNRSLLVGGTIPSEKNEEKKKTKKKIKKKMRKRQKELRK